MSDYICGRNLSPPQSNDFIAQRWITSFEFGKIIDCPNRIYAYIVLATPRIDENLIWAIDVPGAFLKRQVA